jgi:hypothetical protein
MALTELIPPLAIETGVTDNVMVILRRSYLLVVVSSSSVNRNHSTTTERSLRTFSSLDESNDFLQ